MKTWSEYTWPDWVPEEVREQIERFHLEEWGRGPGSWMECAKNNKHPEMGTYHYVARWGDKKIAYGRWVPAWNNIARLVRDDGTYICISTCDILDDPQAFIEKKMDSVRNKIAELEAKLEDLDEMRDQLCGIVEHKGPPPEMGDYASLDDFKGETG